MWELEDLQIVCGTMGLPTATVRLRGPDGLARVSTAVGTGPVDAAYQAIDNLVMVPVDLRDYNVQSVTKGQYRKKETKKKRRRKKEEGMDVDAMEPDKVTPSGRG